MAPRLGVYVGRALDVTCRGDNVTYEAIILEKSKCTMECVPELSYFKGGQPPWHVEGTWELDGEDLVIGVTKQDITGPKKDTDMRLAIGADGSLTFRGTRCAWRSPPPEDDKLKVKAEELAKAAAETKAKQAELEASREELRAQRELQDAQSRAEQEKIERLREEVRLQREQQEAEAKEAEEERLRLAAEKEEQESILAKQKEELEALMKAKEDMQRTREEARRKQEEHQKELLEQQSLLEAEKQKLESDRAAREAERAARQAELEAQKEELQKQKNLVEWQQKEEEELRQAQAAELKMVHEELEGRADSLVRTEEALARERQMIMKSRSSLAMVQAHVAEPTVDCAFSDWGEWSACSGSCDGIKRRSRRIGTYGRGDGKFCVGGLKETAPCNGGEGGLQPEGCAEVPPIDCLLSSWTEWSQCSASCGGGEQVRSRELLREPSHGGQACVDPLSEVTECNRDSCARNPKDCTYGEWQEWSACAKCDGERKRFRHIVQYPEEGGKNCEPAAHEELGSCPRSCGAKTFCTWSSWKEWGPCTAQCGEGRRSRRRHLSLSEEPAAAPQELLAEFEELRLRNQQLLARQSAAPAMAFACGCLSFFAAFALVRFSARRPLGRPGLPGSEPLQAASDDDGVQLLE